MAKKKMAKTVHPINFMDVLSSDLVLIIGKMAVDWTGNTRIEVQNVIRFNLNQMRLVSRVFAQVMYPCLHLWSFENNVLRAYLAFLNANKDARRAMEAADTEDGHTVDPDLQGNDFVASMATRIEEMKTLFLKQGGVHALYAGHTSVIKALYEQFLKYYHKGDLPGCKVLIETMRSMRKEKIAGIYGQIAKFGITAPANYDQATDFV